METDPTKKFSKKADFYARYRPSYPQAVVDCLREEGGLGDTAVVADIGSGTGILSELLLKNGFRVYGIEPNNEMRQQAKVQLADHSNFTSINATAEGTTLNGHSIDLITVGQGFPLV